MKIKSFFYPFLYILGYILLPIVFSVFLSLFKIPTILGTDLTLVLSYLLTFGIYIYIFKDSLSSELKDAYQNKKDYLKIALKYWFLGFIAMVVVNLIVSGLILKSIAPNESANREIIAANPIYTISFMCLLGPVLEEITFRLSFKKLFKSERSFVLFTGILFAAAHVVFSITDLKDLLYIFPYATLGIAFGVIYYRTDNIFSSMFAHILHNSLSILAIMML